MKYKTVFTVEARAELRGVDRKTALQILHKLDELENDPMAYGTTPLVRRPEYRRLRVGAYRVIYTIKHDQLVVMVLHVGHRSTIY